MTNRRDRSGEFLWKLLASWSLGRGILLALLGHAVRGTVRPYRIEVEGNLWRCYVDPSEAKIAWPWRRTPKWVVQ